MRKQKDGGIQKPRYYPPSRWTFLKSTVYVQTGQAPKPLASLFTAEACEEDNNPDGDIQEDDTPDVDSQEVDTPDGDSQEVDTPEEGHTPDGDIQEGDKS